MVQREINDTLSGFSHATWKMWVYLTSCFRARLRTTKEWVEPRLPVHNPGSNIEPPTVELQGISIHRIPEPPLRQIPPVPPPDEEQAHALREARRRTVVVERPVEADSAPVNDTVTPDDEVFVISDSASSSASSVDLGDLDLPSKLPDALGADDEDAAPAQPAEAPVEKDWGPFGPNWDAFRRSSLSSINTTPGLVPWKWWKCRVGWTNKDPSNWPYITEGWVDRMPGWDSNRASEGCDVPDDCDLNEGTADKLPNSKDATQKTDAYADANTDSDADVDKRVFTCTYREEYGTKFNIDRTNWERLDDDQKDALEGIGNETFGPETFETEPNAETRTT
ncbi:hypothetical protein B0T14DRAFT_500911 [Immersiella caudata]|uniref:Uncharacterized protein n=1 Tax=Immersiella caudata TaxID=314043 RepID=A0AA39U685_9PEZI|nr:hypothetical protein B0T14DRAFT_500911 [Immersiella caudata]